MIKKTAALKETISVENFLMTPSQTTSLQGICCDEMSHVTTLLLHFKGKIHDGIYLLCTLREKGRAKWILTHPLGFLQRNDQSHCNTELNPTWEDMLNTHAHSHK